MMINNSSKKVFLYLIIFLHVLICCEVSAADIEITDSKIDEVASLLCEKPKGFGRPITDRNAWDKLGAKKSFRDLTNSAKGLINKPLLQQTDELYLDFSRTGNRQRFETVFFERQRRISKLIIAECVENNGRFVPELERVISAICGEKTWLLPAHDRSLANFKGTQIDIDLFSSMVAWELAEADYILNGRLPDKTRELIRENINRRIFVPFTDMVKGKRIPNWWFTTTNNWNSVCLSSVLGSALALIESPKERAFYVVTAMEYSKNFLNGFTEDGYCTEGLGYWNFGFGHYTFLAESIYQATDGRIDLFNSERIKLLAGFPGRIEIINGIYPAFADCLVYSRPDRNLMTFLNHRYNLGMVDYSNRDNLPISSRLFEPMMYFFDNSAWSRNTNISIKKPGLRSYFDKTGILICRPPENSKCILASVLKGGNNGEHHNHNDVGSFVVVVGDQPVLLDPGPEVYTARTFDNRRYESKVLNSFGHPVPRIANQLQQTGQQAKSKTLKTNFTDQTDTFVLDISDAYNVKELQKLIRTFIYSRENVGSLTVTDEIVFDSPKEYETALITFGTWQKISENTIRIDYQGRSLKVSISASGSDFDITSEKIDEDLRINASAVRIAVTLKEPVKNASVTMKIVPLAD